MNDKNSAASFPPTFSPPARPPILFRSACLWALVPLLAIPALAQTPPGFSDADMREDLLRAVAVHPHPRQVAWQQLEFIAFTHFGVNTFTGREWGTGQEKEEIFNPTQLDCRQWVRVCQSAGVTEIILTAKHHDGFCLWPSRFTEHSVKNSPWRGGHGDVVGELAAACRKAGMKLGIYLSPADLNAIERGVYGSKQPPQGRTIPSAVPGWRPKSAQHFEGEWDDYNTYFMNQLFELLTEYGDISEVWFDGANPKPGTGQKYAYQDWYRLIRTLQPKAVIFGKGPDVRWVGNESGQARPIEWSVVPIPAAPEEYTWSDMTDGDLGSRQKIKGASHLVWYPAETDVSIRPGWFYHASEDNNVKSLRQLLDIYYGAVGGNAVFLLNLPPDQRGLIHENDARTLQALGDVVRQTFKDNLAVGAKVTASNVRGNSAQFAAQKTIDADNESYWTTDDWTTTAELVYELPKPHHFNRAMLQEQIRVGQRIEACALDVWLDGAWKETAKALTVGYKRLLRFDPVTTDRVRVRIMQSRVAPTLANFGLYFEAPRVTDPVLRQDRAGNVNISCPTADAIIRYTLDGSEPTRDAGAYLAPIALACGGSVKARAFTADGTEQSAAIQAAYDALASAGPRPHSAILPVTQNRDWRSYDWVKRHAAVMAAVHQHKPDLVFIGDSITHFFGGEPSDYKSRGPEVWNKFYAPRNAINLGFGWDRTENVLWRLQHGELAGASPKVVVLLIGTNNLDLNTPEQIADGIRAIIAELRARLPRTKVLLLGILPRSQKPDGHRAKLAEVNEIIRQLDGQNGVTFLDVGAQFVSADGTIAHELMDDYLHPTARGYQLWAAAMEPMLSKLFGD